ncbi:MAG: Rieske (2Fe-2S) protein [Alphaproteobacteria bacterium]|nr:Rieske (2Fe-2S) protein [Alphaproteobacteria bacterium]
MRRRLCRADELAEGTARGFVFGAGAERRALFVLRHGGAIRAYRNACPHQGTPLEIVPDQFFDSARRHLLCRTHGARFRPSDGACVAGPCLGRNLTPTPVRVEDGLLILDDPD